MKENLFVATVTGVGPLEQERRLCVVSPGVARGEGGWDGPHACESWQGQGRPLYHRPDLEPCQRTLKHSRL
jgi:hypothetical protein